jgi:indolepyruvate ferredoxin oxidoreductase
VSPAARSLLRLIDAPPGSELSRLVGIRVPDLIAYKDTRYARSYARFIADVLAVETELVPGSTRLTESVARHLYKLMAYKDEYEVARLSIDPAVRAEVHKQFGPGAKASVRLHPPVLRALGMKRKITLGPWFTPAFALLARLRRLRGTKLDIFGYSTVRRTERELIDEYRTAILDLLPRLSPDNAELIVRIADLPDVVRSYEHVKLRSVEKYWASLGDLLAQLTNAPSLHRETL